MDVLTIENNNKEYNLYYEKYYKHNINSEYARNNIVAWESNTQEKNFRLVSKYIDNNDTLIDYGCGIGDLINYLYKNKKPISNYLGIDINFNFISIAKESYPGHNFKLITNVNEIKSSADTICVIGVFTWFITKQDLISCVNKLYELCNKQILITCLYDYTLTDVKWDSNYRKYNKAIFKQLFPNYRMQFDYAENNTLLIRILKK